MRKTIDGRGLVAPEPFERAMSALDALGPDDELQLLLPCRPQPLYRVLQRNGFVWREVLAADGTVEVYITQRPATSG